MIAPSPKQLVVLRHAALGRSNREIGRQLWMAEETVKTHLRVLFKKLEAKDRAHAVSIAVFAGYLEFVPVEGGFEVLTHTDGPARIARQRQVRDIGEYVMSKTENAAVLGQVRARVLAGAS